jgi:hypothetical protein
MADASALESKLSKMRETAAQRLPQLVDLNRQMVEELESSVIADALDVGDLAPDFELNDAKDDTTVRLSDALKEGPVVLSFYRGQW